MQKRHKDLMRTLVTELRHILVGTVASDGTVLRGDLDRELERLGIAPDGTIIPLDAVTNPALHERTGTPDCRSSTCLLLTTPSVPVYAWRS